MDYIKEIIVMCAPLAAGFVTSIVIPFLIKRITVSRLEKKIDEVSESEQLKRINKRLDYIENSIDIMRGIKK